MFTCEPSRVFDVAAALRLEANDGPVERAALEEVQLSTTGLDWRP